MGLVRAQICPPESLRFGVQHKTAFPVTVPGNAHTAGPELGPSPGSPTPSSVFWPWDALVLCSQKCQQQRAGISFPVANQKSGHKPSQQDSGTRRQILPPMTDIFPEIRSRVHLFIQETFTKCLLWEIGVRPQGPLGIQVLF